MELHDVRKPADLKGLGEKELEELAGQLRQRIIQVVSDNGGHLASNLGMVELTIALHRVFDSPRDKIVFDVGHQSYAHKMLTGREGEMDSLRQYGGISGFPKREESEYDAYGTGHASTGISAALGLARARDLKGEEGHVVVGVGDGALTGGLCYEALNDAGNRKTRLIVILNDNGMSIAPNVGAVSESLTYMRTSKAWLHAKASLTDALPKVPLIGKPLFRFTRRVKDSVRNFLVRDGLFTSLGFRYLGPMDGHNIPYLEKVLQRAKRLKEPVLIHAVTQKGKGYAYAEREPWSAHGVNPFHPENGQPRNHSQARSFGAAAGELLTGLAAEDRRIVAITAAMAEATGLAPFQQAYPDRLFDVGIAESHAVTLAAGLASGGMKPFVALYDTFLQRAYDQVVVDICLQNLPAVFLIDRAAMGGADGPTHHGVFGTAFLRHVPGLTLLYPRSVEELEAMIRFAQRHPGPVFIRYPRLEGRGMKELPCRSFSPGKWESLLPGEGPCLVATGPMVSEAVGVRQRLMENGLKARVVNASSIKPLDTAFLRELTARQIPYYVLEEQVLAGGLGGAVSEYCVQNNLRLPDHIFALPDTFIPHGSHEDLLRHCGLDAESLYRQIMSMREAIA